MFDIYNPNTYSEVPDGYIIINGERLFKDNDKKDFITYKEITTYILELEKFLQKREPSIKLSKDWIHDFLYRLYFSSSETNIDSHLKTQVKKDWISDDIKAMVDSEGKPLSRKLQGRIQIIRESKFQMISHLPEEDIKKARKIFLECLEKGMRRYRIKQEVFHWDVFVDQELYAADAIAYIKDEVYNSKPGEKVYFKRFEMADCCSKCKKMNGKLVLWSDTPLDSNKIKDEYAKYAIWDDRFTEKKSKIPLTWCCDDCRGTWVRYYPDV